MASAKLTSKGQITIPKEVREALGLHTGDRLAFRLRDDGVVSVEAEKVSLASLRGAVRPKVRGVTVAAMNEAIRKAGSRG
jgi:antitoxin PrlF